MPFICESVVDQHILHTTDYLQSFETRKAAMDVTEEDLQNLYTWVGNT
jgi:hypothetical protein